MRVLGILLLLSLGLNVLMGSAIGRLENYHYASQLGLCRKNASGDDFASKMAREECLNRQEMRGGILWHIYYALTDEISD